MSFPSLLLMLGTLLVLQATFLDCIAINGIKPDVVMIFVIFNGFLLGPREGAFLGYAGGIIQDLFVGSYLGLNALTLMLAGFLSGVCGERLYKENSLIVAVVTFFSSTASLSLYYILLRYLNINIHFIPAFLQIIIPTAFYSMLVVPLFYLRVYRSLIIKNKDVN